MFIRHGSLAIDVPDDWRDESMLVFVSPSRRPAMLTSNPVASTGEAVAVRFAIAGKLGVEEILKQQETALKTIDPSFRAVSEQPFRFAIGDGVMVEQETHVGGIATRQLVGCVILGPVAIMATASAPASEFDSAKPRLLKILASLAAVP